MKLKRNVIKVTLIFGILGHSLEIGSVRLPKARVRPEPLWLHLCHTAYPNLSSLAPPLRCHPNFHVLSSRPPNQVRGRLSREIYLSQCSWNQEPSCSFWLDPKGTKRSRALRCLGWYVVELHNGWDDSSQYIGTQTESHPTIVHSQQSRQGSSTCSPAATTHLSSDQ